MPKPKGSPKTGGRVKGTPNVATLDRIAAREVAREIIMKHLEPLIAAQLHNAMGIGHLMLRDPDSGKFERVTTTGDPDKDKAVIDAAIGMGRQQCWVYLKDPSIQAFTDLMNRAIGKPAEEVEISGKDGDPIVVQWVVAKK